MSSHQDTKIQRLHPSAVQSESSSQVLPAAIWTPALPHVEITDYSWQVTAIHCGLKKDHICVWPLRWLCLLSWTRTRGWHQASSPDGPSPVRYRQTHASCSHLLFFFCFLCSRGHWAKLRVTDHVVCYLFFFFFTPFSFPRCSTRWWLI